MSRDKRDSDLHNIVTDPSLAFHALRAARKSSSPVVKRMEVGKKVYSGINVADGMYESLSTLKAPDMNNFNSSPHYTAALDTYSHILKLASNGGKIPNITLEKGREILLKLKKSALDLFSITFYIFSTLAVKVSSISSSSSTALLTTLIVPQ